MKNKILCMLCACVFALCGTFSMTCFAAAEPADPSISTYSYREDLLVSYIEYWYTEGGNPVRVVYGEQYQQFTFLNGYEETSRTSVSLPITSEYPHGTTQVKKITVHYRFF
ncbi:MAG: hypothetical protein PHO10_06740 [Gemmiger sp.]|nr:hypothetical protein [Gemmiger sp.]